MQILMGTISGRMNNKGQDKYGRWAWTKIQGKNKRGTLPSTTGTPTVIQISDVTMYDQTMPLADMSGEKQKKADGTNHTNILTSQVALAEGLSTQEEPTLGAAGD